MRTNQAKTGRVNKRKAKQEKVVGWPGTKNCRSPPLDKFSFGHVMFGLVTASFMLPVSFYYLSTLSDPEFLETSKIWSTIIASVIALTAFISWEYLEHGYVKKNIYLKKYKMKGWCETKVNSFLDVVVDFAAFTIYYVPSIIFSEDWQTIILLTILPLAISPLVAYLVTKRRK